MSSRQKVLGLDVRARRESLDDEKGREPAREERGDRAAPHAEDRDEAGDRCPLRDPRAPEELAHVVHLLRQWSRSSST